MTMGYKTVKYNRQILYDQVWSVPMIKLAKEYGLSDNGLRKVCKKMHIPLPPPGYWNKLAYGKAVKKIPLPKYDGEDELVVNRQEQEVLPVDPTQVDTAESLIAAESLPENKITIGGEPSDFHPLVKRTARNIKKTKIDEFGRVHISEENCLQIYVCPENVDRALRIMDAFIKALETRGSKVVVDKKTGYSCISILGEELAFWIREPLMRADAPLTRKQKEELESGHLYGVDRYQYHSTGTLKIEIATSTDPDSWRSASNSVGDTQSQPLEERLNKVIVAMIKAAVKKRSKKLERERWQREWQEKERIREEKERLREEDEAKFNALKRDASLWHTSRQIREFVDAVKQTYINNHGLIEQGSDIDKWLTWAYDKVNAINPLVK